MKETTHQVNASAQTTEKMSLSQMIDTAPSIDPRVSQRSNSISSPQRLSKQEKNRMAQRNHVQQQKAYLEDLEAKIQELNMLLPAEARMAQPSSPSNRERTQSPMSPSMTGNSSSSSVGMSAGKRHGNTKTVETSALEDLPLHERRMIQNRISQRTSRLRKKKRIADLELHVQQLQQKVIQLGLVALTDPVPVPCPVATPTSAAKAAEAPTLVSIPSSDDVDKQLPSLRSIFPGFFASMPLPNGNRNRAQTM
ncbi:hypothetical protein BJ741DRAFT_577569 [Chytriomyces cf. hyalinus JEL632]|nr:hypothetical protein BJ741DRAFT_577569 [Chytriomyces cf. hyalinus JEL632]